FIVLFLLFCAPAVNAESILRAGISVEEGYDSNIYREHENEVSEWTTTVSPILDYTRTARRSLFSLRYVPGFVYSCRTEDTRLDHLAAAEFGFELTRNLHVDFSDTFVKTEDPYEDPGDIEGGIDLSDRRGRRRYWTNRFEASAAYTYGMQRVLEMGYRNHVLRDQEEDYFDYVRHSPFATVSHRINHQWDVRLEYNTVIGDFAEESEESEDLISNTGDFYLYYRITPFTRIFGHLGYSRTDYEEGTDDYEVYTAASGVGHNYSPTLDLEFEAGASRVKRKNFSDTSALYMRAGIDKTWERTSWYIDGESGLDAHEFSGAEEDLGLSRYWSFATGFSRTLMRGVEGAVDFSYRHDDYFEREPAEDEQLFEASAGLSWAFARWYEVFCRYSFVDQNADTEEDKYVDHRFFAGISAERDFFRW
ncbi:MAG: hypothetical protein ACOCR8_03475, partial [Desulfosalsimonas sp.]